MTPISIQHNLQPSRFMWLWAKYVTGINPACHCTNCLRGPYSQRFSAHNPTMAGSVLTLDEAPQKPWIAIYLCGVAKGGYPRSNYPHNLHAALVPTPGIHGVYQFEHWTIEAENASFTSIPDESHLPTDYRELAPAFTTCRIFRWAVVHGLQLPHLPQLPRPA